MSLPVPSHLLETVGAAATTTLDAAGELVHDAVMAVRGRRNRSARRIPAIAAWFVAALVIVAALMATRRRFGTRAAGVGTPHNDPADKPSPGKDMTGRNHTMTQHTDDLKGRIKEAAGTLTGNDELQQDGKRDQQAAKAKQAVDKARDVVNDGIDAVKEKLSKS